MYTVVTFGNCQFTAITVKSETVINYDYKIEFYYV